MIFEGINTNSSRQLDEIKIFLNGINEAFPRIFGSENGTNLFFKNLLPPAGGKPGQLLFQKGNSEINYNLLSSGEKEVVSLLFTLFARNKFYNDTIYFIDETDAHLNTGLQKHLLKEIVDNWIPENCQLWTASHSLGFIEYAKENERAVVLDFVDYDFDYPEVVTPEPKDNPIIYDIAVDKDFLPKLFEGFICFAENTDRVYYSQANLPKIIFVPEKGRNAVYHKVKTGAYEGIIDRGYLSDDDIAEIEKHYPGLKVLKYYSFENYIHHPDNIEEYNRKRGLPFNKELYIEEIRQAGDQVVRELTMKIATIRSSYPFFDDTKFDTKENTSQRRFKNKRRTLRTRQL